MSRIPTMTEVKDPDENRAYAIDWSYHLGADTISTSTWAVISGSVTVATESETTTKATVLLAGGTIGEIAEVHNRVVTSGGETLDQSLRIAVRKR